MKTSDKVTAKFLECRGYAILGQSWPCDAGTLDVVARDPDGTLVFAAVRLSEDPAAGFPAERLDPEARSRMELLAASWLSEHDVPDPRVRFDALSVVVLGGLAKKAFVRHHIGAFDGPTE